MVFILFFYFVGANGMLLPFGGPIAMHLTQEETSSADNKNRLWGNINDLRAHLRGLRDMIKSRGGFRTLGLNGLISKLAIS